MRSHTLNHMCHIVIRGEELLLRKLDCFATVCLNRSETLQVCECVVILRNLKDVSWAGAKAMMADTGFLKGLVEFDKDSLSDKQVCPVCPDSCSNKVACQGMPEALIGKH